MFRTFLRMLALLLGLCAQGKLLAQQPELVVLLTPRSIPFSYLDDSGQLSGFNVDMARAVCRELGRSCRLEVKNFPDIVPAVSEGRADLGVANFLRTPEREALVRFSMPYWRSSSAFVARRGTAQGNAAELLARDGVCAIKGSMQARYLAEQGKGVGVIEVESNQDALDGLLSGRCPVVLLPTMQVLPFLQREEGRGFAFLGTPLNTDGLGGTVHMIVRPDDPRLLEEVDAALQRIIHSGEHERAARRYFPFSIL